MSKLEELKVGDEVVVTVGGIKPCTVGGTKLCTVERVTKMYITAGGIRFNRRQGWATGANNGSIRPATEKDIQKYGDIAAKQ